MEAFTINGKMVDDKRIDQVVGKGDTEIWEVKNNSLANFSKAGLSLILVLSVSTMGYPILY